MDYDIMVRGGTVADSTRLRRYRAAVGVRDGRVVRLGRIAATVTAGQALYATDCVVAPRFVDAYKPLRRAAPLRPVLHHTGWHS